VLQVQANPRPGVKPSTHRVHQDVRVLQMCRGVRVPGLPSLQTREGLVFLLGARDLDQRMLGHAPA